MDEDEVTYLPSEDILEEYDLEDAVRPDSQEQDIEDMSDFEGEHDDLDHTEHPGKAPSTVFVGHSPAEVYAAAFCADIICSGGEDDRIFFYRISSSDLAIQVLHEEQHEDSVSCIAVHNGQSLIASGWVDGVVRVHKYNINNSSDPVSLIAELDGICGEVLWIKWRADKLELAAGGEDGAVWVWSIQDGDDGLMVKHVFSGSGCSSMCGTFLASDDSCLIVGDDRGNVFIYDVDNGNLVKKMDVPSSAISICSHSTRKTFLVGTMEGAVFQGGVSNACKECPGHSDAVESMSFYGNSFITASFDGNLNILDDQKMVCKFSMQLNSGICCMQVNNKGTTVVGCEDGRVVSFDCRTGQQLDTFLSINAPILNISMSPDWKQMAVCNAAGQVSIYDLE